MIALTQNLPLVEWQHTRNVPLSEGWLAESIQASASTVGVNHWHCTEDVAKAIAYYLEYEFNGTVITPEQLQVLIKKSLQSIGYPEIADALEIVAPRVSIQLFEMADRSRHEMIFFNLLHERLNEARAVQVRGIRLAGLKDSVKILENVPRWQSSCDSLRDDIVIFTRNHLLKWEHHPVELLIE